MNSGTMLQAFFGFNQAMNERLWTIIMGHLTDAQFAQADGYSRGSIRNQIVHMAEAQYYWLRGLLDVAGLPELEAADYPTREAARAVCQQADQKILEVVGGLSEADLERVVEGWGQPVWVGLLQNAQHGTDHRAQILRTLHDLGLPTFEQNFADYMEYLIPMTVQGVIERIGTARGEWDALVRQVSADQIDQPLMDAWTVRDAIAILTWKERRLIEIIQKRVFTGLSFSELAEAERASILEGSQALPLDALIEQHQAAHRAMLEAVRAMSDDDLNSEGMDGMEPDMRFWKAIGAATWWSYPTFAGPLREMLSG
jgi:uncharacterized damage-inducible protein DinB